MKCVYGIRKRCPVYQSIEETFQLGKVRVSNIVKEKSQGLPSELTSVLKTIENAIDMLATNPLQLFDILSKFCSACPYRIIHIEKTVHKMFN